MDGGSVGKECIAGRQRIVISGRTKLLVNYLVVINEVESVESMRRFLTSSESTRGVQVKSQECPIAEAKPRRCCPLGFVQ